MSDYLNRVFPKITVPEGRAGNWEVRKFTVDAERDMIGLLRTPGLCPGDYTGLYCRNQIVMSDTPDEQRDHYRFVQNARGTVLIGGLGLGMCVSATLAKPDVEHVTVLEISPEVIELVAPHYKCDRLTIIQCDALEYKPRNVCFDVVWMDIWGDLSTDDKPEMSTLRRRWRRKSEWMDCWGDRILARCS